jgi:hypothetical protein
MLITKRFSPFEETLWWDTASPAPMTTELEGKKTANVCIVGAGYNGLTTRIELARKGVGVELLEAREAGFGCSGRNAGHCAPTFTYLPLLRFEWVTLGKHSNHPTVRPGRPSLRPDLAA